MLKDRQDGLVSLHGHALTLTALLLFFAWTSLVETTGWIELVESVNLKLYTFSVFGAFLWVHHSLHGLRSRLASLSWLDSIRLTRQQITRCMVVLFAVAFLTRDIEVSRAFLLGYVILLAAVLSVANVLYPKAIGRLFFRPTSLRTLLVASPDEIGDLATWMNSRQQFGLRLAGWISDSTEEAETTLPRLGSLHDLRRVLMEHDISQVVISQFGLPPDQARQLAMRAEEVGCRVRFFSNPQHYFRHHPITVEHDGEYTFITLTAEPLDNPANRVLKRALDVAVSLPVVLFILPPLAALVAVMQASQSPGPLFHRQYRSGLNRKKFLIYKFRTMYPANAAIPESRQASRHDPRIYPFGRFLRKTSLDEIPQFLNVLRGEMSVSGPRPHLLEHDEQFSKIVNTYYTRHFVKPGITGLAQSKGFRGEILEQRLLHKRIGYDMLYVRRWSLALDLRIIFETFRQVLFPPRSAY